MSELGGTHATKDGNTKYVWSLGFANMYRNMPDLMRITYRTPIQSIPLQRLYLPMATNQETEVEFSLI